MLLQRLWRKITKTDKQLTDIENKINDLLYHTDESEWGEQCGARASGMIEMLNMLGYPCRIEMDDSGKLYLLKEN